MAGDSARRNHCISERFLLPMAFVAIALSPFSRLQGQSGISKRFPQVDWEAILAPSGARYAGRAACAECHPNEASSQALTPMAHALALPADSEVLRKHPRLTFRQGPYFYQILREGNGDTRFAVSDGTRTISVSILWAFGYGSGGVGQTYVFKYGGRLLESQVSYFDAIQGLDITIGHSPEPPASLDAALGTSISERLTRKCFSCHATAAVSQNSLQLAKMIPGISCERCHGPGQKHIAAVKAGKFKKLHIFNPGHLSTGDLRGLCGSCHQASLQTTMAGTLGINTARFQSYRLARGRCYDPDDPRIGCLACHNPHQATERNAAFYDAKCLACHPLPGKDAPANPKSAARSCPVSERECVTCHMPKVEIPQTHHKFPDHWIRVAKDGGAYPD